MAYTDKEILRDRNGNPIPQIWDSALNNFVPYEGKVTLSGKNAVLAHRHINAQELGIWLHAGTATTNPALIVPLDISQFQDIAIVMKNGGANAYAISEIRYYGGLSADDLLFAVEFVDELRVPSGVGARIVFDKDTPGLESLGKPWVGLAVKYSASAALERTITIIGRSRS